MTNQKSLCSYKGPNGETCDEEAVVNNLCYWHDDSKIKDEPDLIPRLEQRARTGKPMVGFKLRSSMLDGINLVRPNSAQGYQLIYSDLYRAHLEGSHLFNINLHGTSLMKANLMLANLNCARLTSANLLGVQMEGAKLAHVRWDVIVIQEVEGRKCAADDQKRLDCFEQAEGIYRNLCKINEAQGLYEEAGQFFRRVMIMRRYQLPRYGSKRLLSVTVDLLCGYGEEPFKVVVFSLITVFSFALLYFLFGISDGEQYIQYSNEVSRLTNMQSFLKTVYFSVVTFSTLGYGDLYPVGFSRALAAVEAFLGSFTLALFVVVFVKKMTR